MSEISVLKHSKKNQGIIEKWYSELLKPDDGTWGFIIMNLLLLRM